jgi:hypothetical protein
MQPYTCRNASTGLSAYSLQELLEPDAVRQATKVLERSLAAQAAYLPGLCGGNREVNERIGKRLWLAPRRQKPGITPML